MLVWVPLFPCNNSCLPVTFAYFLLVIGSVSSLFLPPSPLVAPPFPAQYSPLSPLFPCTRIKDHHHSQPSFHSTSSPLGPQLALPSLLFANSSQSVQLFRSSVLDSLFDPSLLFFFSSSSFPPFYPSSFNQHQQPTTKRQHTNGIK